LGSRVLSLLQALAGLLTEALHWRLYAPLPDPSLAIQALYDLGRNLTALLAQALTWTAALLGGRSFYDPLAASLVWSLLLWGLGIWAAWAVRRREQPLAAVLPAGVLLAASLSYTRSPVGYLLPLLAAAFLLLAWTNFHRRRIAWQRAGTDYAEDIYLDLVMWILFFALGLSSMAMALSSISPQEIISFTQRWVQVRSDETDQLGDALGLQMQSAGEGGLGGAGVLEGGLPRQHLLGAGPELSRKLILTVRVAEDEGDTSVGNSSPALTYYWRALTYDVYTGRGWAASHTYAQEYPSGATLGAPTGASRRVVSQQVRPLRDFGEQLYFAGAPISVDQPYKAWLRTSPEQNLDLFGLSLYRSQGLQIYTVESTLPIAGERQLRAAGDEYPDWIASRYLQLPEDGIPERVTELALGLTAGAATPYDQALAIESYLRTITYTLDVPSPPQGRDVADFFLFDLRAGYCDYYATSMAVMARTVGLPARLVMGYAQGTYDAEYDRYVVSEAEAHSWVEIYFPVIGWVEFEPTGGRPAVQRSPDLPLSEVPEPLAGSGASGTAWSAWVRRLALSGALLAILGLGWALSETWRLGHMNPTAALMALYLRIYRQAQRLGTPTGPGDTPHEFAASLSGRIESLAGAEHWAEPLAPAGGEARQIVELYGKAIYGQKPPSTQARWAAIQAWGRLRLRLWLARWLRFVRRK